jgi:hypothetical protein
MSAITRTAVSAAARRWLDTHRSTYLNWTHAAWQKPSKPWLPTALSASAANQRHACRCAESPRSLHT